MMKPYLVLITELLIMTALFAGDPALMDGIIVFLAK